MSDTSDTDKPPRTRVSRRNQTVAFQKRRLRRRHIAKKTPQAYVQWPMTGMRFIFKIQRALNGGNTVLIYDKSRKIVLEMALEEPLKKLFGNQVKIFMSGWLLPDPDRPFCYKIDLRTRVRDYTW